MQYGQTAKSDRTLYRVIQLVDKYTISERAPIFDHESVLALWFCECWILVCNQSSQPQRRSPTGFLAKTTMRTVENQHARSRCYRESRSERSHRAFRFVVDHPGKCALCLWLIQCTCAQLIRILFKLDLTKLVAGNGIAELDSLALRRVVHESEDAAKLRASRGQLS